MPHISLLVQGCFKKVEVAGITQFGSFPGMCDFLSTQINDFSV